MKNILFLALFGIVATMQCRALDWMTDLDAAKAKAKEEKKAVLLDFTGSDWCPPCKQLEKEVWMSKEFAEYAGKNLILVQVDFPQRKKLPVAVEAANDKLQEKFDIMVFPTVIVLSSSGKKLGREEGYGGGAPKDYIVKIDTFVQKNSKK